MHPYRMVREPVFGPDRKVTIFLRPEDIEFAVPQATTWWHEHLNWISEFTYKEMPAVAPCTTCARENDTGVRTCWWCGGMP